MKVLVRCIKGFFDMEFGVPRKIDDEWYTNKPRADILEKNRLVDIVEE